MTEKTIGERIKALELDLENALVKIEDFITGKKPAAVEPTLAPVASVPASTSTPVASTSVPASTSTPVASTSVPASTSTPAA
ncbi:MAG: hypothetical protein P4N59_11560 [Negativicutes bacterium]|nr:hypothetical protein [Negativicutes bacterium]